MNWMAILEYRETGRGSRCISGLHGATTPRAPQACLAAIVACAVLAGCAGSVRPAGTPGTDAEERPSDVAAMLPAPGVEVRPATDRAGIDVERYEVSIDLRDPGSRTFRADATLHVRLDGGDTELALDLAGLDVESVEIDGRAVPYSHDGAILRIGPLPDGAAAGPFAVRVRYGGMPADGLFFGEDRNGDPAIFADNWPNRARWWFPSNDHPSDKATVRFRVRAPDGYGVIANGRLIDGPEGAIEDGYAPEWVWESNPAVPIPTYTMVIGVARFEIRQLGPAACGRSPAVPPAASGEPGCAAVGVWALAGDGDYGAERFGRAPDMLDFYADRVGPYPYEKLAHVESSTRFGGMENASAIFYGRGGWEGRRMGEGVIAHETAHQWFGDAVTPASWYHLWVSEGFASYFGPLYFEARDGVDAFRERMESIRRTVIESDVIGQAIVDSSTIRLFDLLNANHYQKGAWVLHMLRGRLGDEAFFRGVRDYYAAHRHGVAVSADVRDALERASGHDLDRFFEQWVYSPGYPMLDIGWRPDGADMVVEVRQRQPADWPVFAFDAEVEVERTDGATRRARISVDERREVVRLEGLGVYAGELRFDPDGWLLSAVEVRRSGD